MSGTLTVGKVRLADEYVADQIESLEQEQNNISGRVTAVTEDLATLTTEVLQIDDTSVSNRVTAVEQDVAALTSTTEVLESTDTSVSNRVTNVEQNVATLASTLVTNYAGVASDISALETNWNNFNAVASIGASALNIERTDGDNTLFSTNGNNWIRGYTYFRLPGENTSRAYIGSSGFIARAQNSSAYHVGDTLQDLLARVSNLE